MDLTISMFATQTDYWRARAELAEEAVADMAKDLGCGADNEAILLAVDDLRRERDELAERLAEIEAQEPAAVVRVHMTGGNAGLHWTAHKHPDCPWALKDGDLLYAGPVAAAATVSAPERAKPAAKTCRCGPDGCPDSVACPKGGSA